jgi:hypothetical protein
MDDQDVVLLRPQLEVRNHRLCRIWIKVLFLNYYVKRRIAWYNLFYVLFSAETRNRWIPSNVDGVLAAYAGTYLQKEQ